MKNRQTFNLPTYVLILTLSLSTLVFSGVESKAVEGQTEGVHLGSKYSALNSAPTQSEGKKTDQIPADSKIFAPQTTAVKDNKGSVAVKNLPLKKESKKSLKQYLFMFLKAMFGVIVSALAIFGGLKLYKGLLLKKNALFESKKIKNSLESPKTFKDALNLFLDKTDK